MASCQPESSSPIVPAAGIPLDLARQRAEQISQLRYFLQFQIPEAPDQPVSGSLTLNLHLATSSLPLILDFRAESARSRSMTR